MMIAIKDMKMPTECEYCGFCRYYPESGNVWCNANNRILKLYWKEPGWTHLDVERPDWCPLIEIKTDGDTISKQAAIDAVLKLTYADGAYGYADAKELVDSLEALPYAQPEPKTMLFDSRLKLAKNYKEWAEENHVIDCAESVIYYLDIIGLIQPEPKTGRWIDTVIPTEDGGLPIQICDQCNAFFSLACTGGGHKFCPNCGAKMMKDGEE